MATRRTAAATAKRSTLFVNSVEKALDVLKVFDSARARLTLSHIATLAGMDLSTAQRFVHTLTELGYLDKDPETKNYSLSPQVFDLSYRYQISHELIQRAAPYIQQLSIQLGETANLTVLHGSDIVYVYRVLGQHMLNVKTVLGARQPAYCTAPGLAMMACLSPQEVDAIMSASDLVAHTPHTVIDPKSIRQRLAKVRVAGYAHTEEEYLLGAISTAAAVRDPQGRIVGAINVAVTKHRWKADDEPRFADLVISTASALMSR